MTITVSVVIPTYNRPEHLQHTVKNVFSQTRLPREVVVVDDHSEQPVTDVLAGIESPTSTEMTIIRHDQNRGANTARNTGIDHASGDVIAFLDDDDRWVDCRLEKMVSVFEDEATAGLVYSGRFRANGQGAVTNQTIPTLSDEPVRDLLLSNAIGSFSNVIIPTQVIEEVGGLDERFPCWQDTDLFVRIANKYDLKCIDECLTIRHFHQANQITGDFSLRQTALKLFLSKYTPLAASISNEFKNRMIARRYFNVGWAAVRTDNHRKGVPYFARAIVTDPQYLRPYAGLIAGVGGPKIESILSYFNQKYISDTMHLHSPYR